MLFFLLSRFFPIPAAPFWTSTYMAVQKKCCLKVLKHLSCCKHFASWALQELSKTSFMNEPTQLSVNVWDNARNFRTFWKWGVNFQFYIRIHFIEHKSFYQRNEMTNMLRIVIVGRRIVSNLSDIVESNISSISLKNSNLSYIITETYIYSLSVLLTLRIED